MFLAIASFGLSLAGKTTVAVLVWHPVHRDHLPGQYQEPSLDLVCSMCKMPYSSKHAPRFGQFLLAICLGTFVGTEDNIINHFKLFAWNVKNVT